MVDYLMFFNEITGFIDRYLKDEKFRDVADKVHAYWAQGEAVPLPLNQWKSLVVKPELLEDDFQKILDEIMDVGAHITGGLFRVTSSYSTPYGSGKSQFAFLLAYWLEEKLESRKSFKLSASRDIETFRESLRAILKEVPKDIKPIIVVDEIDTLISGEKQEITRALMDFANVILSEYHRMKERGKAPIFILVTSPRVDEYLSSISDIETRIGKRIIYTEHAGRLMKSVEDVQEAVMKGILAGSVSGLKRHGADIKQALSAEGAIIGMLYKFCEDAAKFLVEYYGSPERVPIRSALKLGLEYTKRIYVPAILSDDESVRERIKKLGGEPDRVTFGMIIEEIVTKIMQEAFGRWEFMVKDVEPNAVLVAEFDRKKVRVDGFETDFIIRVLLGSNLLGDILGEITAEKTLGSHKEKIQRFLKGGATLLIVAYTTPEERESIKESVASLADESDMGYRLWPVYVPGYFLKYFVIAGSVEDALKAVGGEILESFRSQLKSGLYKLSKMFYLEALISESSRVAAPTGGSSRETGEGSTKRRIRYFSKVIVESITPKGAKMRANKVVTHMKGRLVSLFKEIKHQGVSIEADEKTILAVIASILNRLRKAELISWGSRYGRAEDVIKHDGYFVLDKLKNEDNSRRAENLIAEALEEFVKSSKRLSVPKQTTIDAILIGER